MVWKGIGAICIIAACGGVGFSVAYKQLKEIKLLTQMIRILDRIKKEMQYHLRPTPDLFRLVASEEKGDLGHTFLRIAIELENQIQPDVSRCMGVVISSMNAVPNSVMESLEKLGQELGRYDLEGQILGIDQIRENAMERRDFLNHDKLKRIRGYQTLGLCAGAALVILFI